MAIFRHLLAVGALVSVCACQKTTDPLSSLALSSMSGASGDFFDRVAPECVSAAWPDSGGVVWQRDAAASAREPVKATWVPISNSAECSRILPANPTARLSWDGPRSRAATPICDPAAIDGEGNLAVFFLSDVGTGIGNAFFRSDGSSPAVILNGANEYQSAASARQQGFFVLTHSHEQPWCQYVRPLDADAMGSPALAVASDPDAINALIGNPRGGYVEQRTINHANPDMSETESRLQLRWLYEDLAPAGPWQTVYTLRGLGQTAYHRVFVDDRGLALVLSFVHPPSFGPPPPPSQWSFNARWVGPSGPIGDSFTPAAPTFTAKTGMAYFANWGTAVALEGGGFALFHAPARDPGGGSLSATGWYAFYPSGKASFENPPAWLARYDASLHLVAGDGFPMYAASRKDPDTCARVAQLIAPSGEACFELRLPDSNLCDAQDTFSADGTLVSQNNCQVRWWPKLARAGASHWAAAVRAWLSFSRTTEVP